MIAVGYIRVSTEEQVKHGQGLEIQEKDIEQYCKQHKINLVKVFADKGISGANDINKRKGLYDLLEYCRDNKVNRVIVQKMDRLARDVFIQLWIEKELKITDAEVISVSEDNLNGNDYMTNAMRQMVGVFAELEKNRIAERLLSGRRNKAEAKGLKASGNCPVGYKYKSKKVAIDPQETEIVKEIFSLYLNGLSLQKIADKLNQEGIMTKRGNKWSKQAIQKVLKNDFYTGTVRFGDIEVKGEHEPIINAIVFGKVQAKLDRSRKR